MNAFTNPLEPAPYDPATFDHAAYLELEPGVPDSQRYDGWTPDKQKRFLTALARGHNVTRACALVGMSRQAAYAFRNAPRGRAFARAWCDARRHARAVKRAMTLRPARRAAPAIRPQATPAPADADVDFVNFVNRLVRLTSGALPSTSSTHPLGGGTEGVNFVNIAGGPLKRC